MTLPAKLTPCQIHLSELNDARLYSIKIINTGKIRRNNMERKKFLAPKDKPKTCKTDTCKQLLVKIPYHNLRIQLN